MNYIEELEYRETLWPKLRSRKHSLHAVSHLHWYWNLDRPSGDLVLAHPYHYSYSKYFYAEVLQLSLKHGVFIYSHKVCTPFAPPLFDSGYWASTFDKFPAPPGVSFVGPLIQCPVCDSNSGPREQANPLTLIDYFNVENRNRADIKYCTDHRYQGRVIVVGFFDPSHVPPPVLEVTELTTYDFALHQSHCGMNPGCPAYKRATIRNARKALSKSEQNFFRMSDAASKLKTQMRNYETTSH